MTMFKAIHLSPDGESVIIAKDDGRAALYTRAAVGPIREAAHTDRFCALVEQARWAITVYS